MSNEQLTCLLISDFNISNLAGYLRNDTEAPLIEIRQSNYGQVQSVLYDSTAPCWDRPIDIALIWTRPEGVIESFEQFRAHEDVSLDRLLKEVDIYAEAVLQLQDRARLTLVPTWVIPCYERGMGLLDEAQGGLAHALRRMNVRLADRLLDTTNILPLDASRWIASSSSNAFNPKYWYMSKSAFGPDVYKEAAVDVKAAARALSGKARKLLVVDLDDTLWGGIVGEIGWEALRLGGHDAIGEAFVAFQYAIKSLQNRGVVVGVVSKNDEQVATEAIESHPEMVLRLNDFAGWRINWQDKAQNIIDLAHELNLGLDSVVFIDDNPAERGRVREALPQVFVPEWPDEKMRYSQALLNLAVFDTLIISNEDRQRSQMYAAERERRQLQTNVTSIDGWLKSLELRVEIAKLNEANLERAVQLLNRTNQMNLTTRRMTAAELWSWAADHTHCVWTFRAVDRFGDSGITGLLGVQFTSNSIEVIDFILSCRVFGRQIENLMAHVAIEYAQKVGALEVKATYCPTKKNKPCLEFWQHSGFSSDDGLTFLWQASRSYPPPKFINAVDINTGDELHTTNA